MLSEQQYPKPTHRKRVETYLANNPRDGLGFRFLPLMNVSRLTQKLAEGPSLR